MKNTRISAFPILALLSLLSLPACGDKDDTGDTVTVIVGDQSEYYVYDSGQTAVQIISDIGGVGEVVVYAGSAFGLDPEDTASFLLDEEETSAICADLTTDGCVVQITVACNLLIGKTVNYTINDSVIIDEYRGGSIACLWESEDSRSGVAMNLECMSLTGEEDTGSSDTGN